MSTNTIISADYDSSSTKVMVFPGIVRTRPGMFIGSVCNFGRIVIAREPLDNSIDELLNGFGDCITITVDTENRLVQIQDSGRGMPFDLHPDYENKTTMEVLSAVLYAGGKFDENAYKTSGGLNGVGIKATNALSNFFQISSIRGDKGYEVHFEKGEKVYEGPIEGDGTTGTTVLFQPDDSIFVDAETEFYLLAEMQGLLRIRSYLNPKVPFILNFDDTTESFEADNIGEFVTDNFSPEELLIPETVIFSGEGDGAKVGKIDIAFNFVRRSLDETIVSFTNTIQQSDGGEHVNGFRAGFVTVFQNLIESKDWMPKKLKTLKLVPSDFMEGIFGIVSIKHSEPTYRGV